MKDQKPLTIKNGKFYRGNQNVRPVVGDREQIDLLQKIQSEFRLAHKNGFMLAKFISKKKVVYDAYVSFNCPSCGWENECVAGENQPMKFVNRDLDGNTINCVKCGQGFKFAPKDKIAKSKVKMLILETEEQEGGENE
jgi:transcription elongation factor Elf1